MSDSAFDALLRAQTSPEARERMHQARRELDLGENDAMWGLVRVVQDYCASLGPPRCARAPTAPSPAPWVFQPWQLLCAGLALQTGALSIAFLIGRNWSRAQPPDTSWLHAALSAPAGWMMFLLVLPVLSQGVVSSWQARSRDRFASWLLLCVFAGALIASASALCWLLSC